MIEMDKIVDLKEITDVYYLRERNGQEFDYVIETHKGLLFI